MKINNIYKLIIAIVVSEFGYQTNSSCHRQNLL